MQEYNLSPDQILNRLYKGKKHGYSEEEIARQEKYIGMRLPEVLLNYYLTCSRLSLSYCQNSIVPPHDIDLTYYWMDRYHEQFEQIYHTPLEELKAQTQNYLLFWYEPKKDTRFGIPEKNLHEANPPVYVHTDKNRLEWKLRSRDMNSFLTEEICRNASACKDFKYYSTKDSEDIAAVIEENEIDLSRLFVEDDRLYATCWDSEKDEFYIFTLGGKERQITRVELLTPKVENSFFSPGQHIRVEEYLRQLREDLQQESLQDVVLLTPSTRLKLYRLIDDSTTVNKIFLECAKKVFPIYQQEFPQDRSFAELVRQVQEYLYYGWGDSKKIEDLSASYAGYFSAASGKAGAAGMALCTLVSDLLSDKANSSTLSALHTSDVYAYMAYTGEQEPYQAEHLLSEKGKEFWSWYIDTVATLMQDIQTPVGELPLVPEWTEYPQQLFERTQSTLTCEVERLMNKIKSLLQLSMQAIGKDLRKTSDWKKVVLTVHTLGGTRCTAVVENVEGTCIPLTLSDEIASLFDEIKKKMYWQFPEQGAWLRGTFKDEGGLSSLEFDYDSRNRTSAQENFVPFLLNEFANYPRRKDYTPEWWQALLGPDAPYLNIPARSQVFETDSIRQLLDKLKKWLFLYLEMEGCDTETAQWNRCTVSGVLIEFMTRKKLTALLQLSDGTYKEIPIPPTGEVARVCATLLLQVKAEMYAQQPGEGAWLWCSLTVDRNEKQPDVMEFNYDELHRFKDQSSLRQYFFNEFRKYPRQEKYTPMWLKYLLQGRMEFLKEE